MSWSEIYGEKIFTNQGAKCNYAISSKITLSARVVLTNKII